MNDSNPDTSRTSPWELSVGPSLEHWEDWIENDADAWPDVRERHYRCIPTICFNCESGCGLLAFVDKESGDIAKFEGNPLHPGSRGRTCAKGPASINQVNDSERILKPLKRKGPRGGGEWEEVSWEEALDDIGGRIGTALREKRHNEIMYHVGRPGEDHFALRMLQAWGVDAHNSHTNVCSASARLGFSISFGADRPSPDYAHAKFVLLISAHLETGHYFNPHAQRIIEAKNDGARIAVVDTRLSNTSTHADHWISPWPGTEAAMLLATARLLILSGRVDMEFMERWTNWKAYLDDKDPAGPGTLQRYLDLLAEEYAQYTPEYAVQECKIQPGSVEYLADSIAEAGSAFASHLWRNTAAGNLGGWQVARALMLLHSLSGSVGTKGGLNPNSWDKFVPKPSLAPPPHSLWNEALWPKEWPLAHYEMSFLLPHLLRDQGAKVDTYFTRVYNPVWTNPDGCSWIEMFEEPDRIGCHVALTPTWNETAQWADYVLPMGLASERHDVMSQETHAGTWIGFRQPVGREFARLQGENPQSTLGTNPGEVWEEAEFWIALTHRIDPDGSLGIAKYFESPTRSGEPMTMDEYWSDVFGNVPGLPEAAEREGQSPLEFMRRRGAFEVPYGGRERYATKSDEGLEVAPGDVRSGFNTPSKSIELYSPVMGEWGFDDGLLPSYQRSQVHWSHMDMAAGDRALLPTFRLPTLIHTRSANAKWLQEISHTNPLWIHPEDAAQFGLQTGDLVRVHTGIGYFIPRAWVTEGMHPGVVACSHHVGRWRMFSESGAVGASSLVNIERDGSRFLFRAKQGAAPFKSGDPDTERVHWKEAGVNQNMTFPVQPDPASGMHCWHQKVNIQPAQPGDCYGDISVDTSLSRKIYDEWKAMTKPAPGPGGLRRPLHMNRPLRPTDDAYKF